MFVESLVPHSPSASHSSPSSTWSHVLSPLSVSRPMVDSAAPGHSLKGTGLRQRPHALPAGHSAHVGTKSALQATRRYTSLFVKPARREGWAWDASARGWERLGVQQSGEKGGAVLTPSQFMFSQLLSTVDVPHSPSASHILPTATSVQLAMTSRASLAGHSVCAILFKQNPQESYPASQRAHGKPARDEESASNSSAAIGPRMLEFGGSQCHGWRALS